MKTIIFFKYFFNRKFELPPKEWLHPEKFTTFLMYAWTSKRTPCVQIVSLLCGKTSQKRDSFWLCGTNSMHSSSPNRAGHKWVFRVIINFLLFESKYNMQGHFELSCLSGVMLMTSCTCCKAILSNLSQLLAIQSSVHRPFSVSFWPTQFTVLVYEKSLNIPKW